MPATPQFQPYRIVHVIAQLRFGAGRYVVDTAIAQHRREPGCVVVVLSEDAEAPWVSSGALVAELRSAGVPVVTAGNFFHRQAATMKSASVALRDAALRGNTAWTPDTVVHAHTAMAAAAARWAGAPRVVLTCHGWGPGRAPHVDLEDALAYQMCDAVTSPSEHWAATIREKTAVERVHVIPYGVDLSRVAPVQTAAPAVPRMMCVAELTHRKGQDLLLAAMADIWARQPRAELHLVGEGDCGPALREQARQLDPSGTRIVFHGMVDAPWSLTTPYDVFVLPTRSDNQPLALIEAMAAGLPIVATGVGGIRQMVTDARCGFVVPPENVFELRMAISVLLDTAPAGRRELGAAGIRYARATFDIATHLAALDGLYVPTMTSPLHADTPFELPAGPVRLYLGCDREHRHGWVNVDARAEVSPDVVAVAHQLRMFPDGSVDQIEACHLFEHLPLHEAHAALAEWARVLRPGAELLLELPNIDACIHILAHAKNPGDRDLAMGGIFGWQPGVEANGDDWAHRWGWSPESLRAALESHGFGCVEVLAVTQTYRQATRLDRDFRIRGIRLASTAEAAA
jgi:glycosyltransferase involved in cell wall biosynthesis